MYDINVANGDIAQLVERYNGIVEVRGSTPLISTIRSGAEYEDFSGNYIAFAKVLE